MRTNPRRDVLPPKSVRVAILYVGRNEALDVLKRKVFSTGEGNLSEQVDDLCSYRSRVHLLGWSDARLARRRRNRPKQQSRAPVEYLTASTSTTAATATTIIIFATRIRPIASSAVYLTALPTNGVANVWICSGINAVERGACVLELAIAHSTQDCVNRELKTFATIIFVTPL
jgi:hypothetical protein